MKYEEFIKQKSVLNQSEGIKVSRDDLHEMLFDWQKDLVSWALRRGRAALFTMTGTGKTIMQVEFARVVHEHEKQSVLIVSPLAVSYQTIREGAKLGVEINLMRKNGHVDGINITNYEQLEKIDASKYCCIILDESSILKSFTGKIRNMIIEKFDKTKYKLCASATPSPNDFMELGNHSEFLNVLKRKEMLSTFFINDTANVGTWRLKKHASEKFWEWIATWGAVLTKPSDLGYSDDKYQLPELITNEVHIETGIKLKENLFVVSAETLQERRQARKMTIKERVKVAAGLVNNSEEKWLVWCGLNDESAMLAKEINDSVEISGSHNSEYKETNMLNFSDGKIKCLVTKAKIAGFGMNWQVCHNMIFVGLSDSFEAYFQAVRRCYRFGQKKNVNVHIITSDIEGNVLENVKRKEKNNNIMLANLISKTKKYLEKDIHQEDLYKSNYIATDKMAIKRGDDMITKNIECKSQVLKDNYQIYNGDCVELSKAIDDESIDYMVFSPPFADLYTYSSSERDMGNCKDYDDFWQQYKYLIADQYRTMKSGRNVSIHCMNLPSTITRDGFIGLKDFRGDIIREYVKAGFIYHSEVVIWKDPLIAAVRTKAIGLMHKQLMKDSAMCRMGIPDTLLTFRKPGENHARIEHDEGLRSYAGADDPGGQGIKRAHFIWQRYASPVWMDVRQTHVLNKSQARDDKDEKHICPLQLDVIERCIVLWSNPGDVVLSPFAGIGSEGYKALLMDRKFIGFELKDSYFDVMCENLEKAERTHRVNNADLFSEVI